MAPDNVDKSKAEDPAARKAKPVAEDIKDNMLDQEGKWGLPSKEARHLYI